MQSHTFLHHFCCFFCRGICNVVFFSRFYLYRVDERYENLRDLAAQRRKKLLEALAQFQLNREAYVVDTWITERVSPVMNVHYQVDQSYQMSHCFEAVFTGRFIFFVRSMLFAYFREISYLLGETLGYCS